MRALSISRAWDEAKAIMVRDGRLLATVCLALIVLPEAVLWVVGLPAGVQGMLVPKLLYLLVILIGLVGQLALNRLAIGPSITVGGAIGRGFRRLWAVIVAFFILAVGLFIVLLVVALILRLAGVAVQPGVSGAPPPIVVVLMLIVGPLSLAICQLFIPVAAAEDGGPIRLFSRSWALGRKEYLRLLGFIVVVFFGIAIATIAAQYILGSALVLTLGRPVAGSLSALLLGVGLGIVQAAFTLVSAVTLARIYVQLSGYGEAEATVPTTGI
jgi:hypothetical protein